MSELSLKDTPGRVCRICNRHWSRARDFPKMLHQCGRSPICAQCYRTAQATANMEKSFQLVAARQARESLK